MSITVTRRQSFTQFGDTPLKWPNAAACFADGRVAVADSGHDRVVVMSKDGQPLWSGGGRGFALGKLREPIGVFVTPDQYMVVGDWHNHRLVVYTPDFQVSHEIGHLGRLTPIKNAADFIRVLRSFLGNISIGQFGVDRYFTHGKNQHPDHWFSPAMLLRGLLYYACHPRRLQAIFCDPDLAMLKPNGAVFPEGHIVVAQKGFQCLSLYSVEEGRKNPKLVQHTRYEFDRLGHVAMDGAGRVYVCDQQNYRIVVLDKDLQFVHQIDYKRDYADGPFSCCVIDEKYIAAVAGFALEIRDLTTNEIVHEDHNFDETHGIAWDAVHRFLYVVDRSGHAIHQLHVEAQG